MNGVVVTEYVDHAKGLMDEDAKGSGRFTEVTLNPLVTVKETSMIDKANALHNDAHKMCFIANSVNFPVLHKPTAVAPSLVEKN
jgi:organic hydroperoxide reductase OsmC/OhrA